MAICILHPQKANPLLDENGEDCMVGQHGPVWFLMGTLAGGTLARTYVSSRKARPLFPCSKLFFLNTPDVCGQVGEMTVDEMRPLVQPRALMGSRCCRLRWMVSPQEVAEEILCRWSSRGRSQRPTFLTNYVRNLEGFREWTYSPRVDEGFYVMLKPLSVGNHVVRIQAESPACPIAGPVSQDITYNLTVVPVSPK